MQRKLPLIASTQGQPIAAPDMVLRQIKDEAQAVRVSISLCAGKLLFIARSLGKSEGYISRIRNGSRPVPAWFVAPFCRVTGTKLLQQFRDLQAAIREANDARSEVEISERLAEQIRRAA